MVIKKKRRNHCLIPLSKQNYVHFETKDLCNNIISSENTAVGRRGYDEYVFTFIKWFATLRYTLEVFGTITVSLSRPACKASGKIFAFIKGKRQKKKQEGWRFWPLKEVIQVYFSIHHVMKQYSLVWKWLQNDFQWFECIIILVSDVEIILSLRW